jgi:putative CRISPR-associated protein (TIGR02619 family)
MTQPRFVLSPCGTSLLTNSASNLERGLITRHANSRSPEEVSAEDREQLKAVINRARERLVAANPTQAAGLSAELNCLVQLYEGQLDAPRDFHQLLCTDTWLGETTAQLIRDWLRSQAFTVEIRRQQDLQTARLDAFQLALSELVSWCSTDVASYRESGYRVIFNLTGGFKSVQGFLQVLAMFHADETIYVFESSADLLRIPRLPLEMAADSSLREHLRLFRRLGQGLPVETSPEVPEIFLLRVDGQTSFSTWAELLWAETKKKLYGEALHPTPSNRIRYGPGFERSLKDLLPDRLRLINERIDQLARHLEGDGSYNPPSLDFKPLGGNPRPPSTHEIDAWADRDARRIYGHHDAGVFVLNALAEAFH